MRAGLPRPEELLRVVDSRGSQLLAGLARMALCLPLLLGPCSLQRWRSHLGIPLFPEVFELPGARRLLLADSIRCKNRGSFSSR